MDFSEPFGAVYDTAGFRNPKTWRVVRSGRMAEAENATTHGASNQSAVPPLTPMSLGVLLGRIAHEWDTRNRIFDLPTARFWSADESVDLGFSFLGRWCATPVGPAAGPHSQLAQNIVLAWLGGSRLFELKTIQVLDDLEIGRPCIDMQTIGYNIEWSQELTVAQSLEEYVKAWMLIAVLSNWDPLHEHLGEDPGDFVFDMSVGYDLAGISSPKVAGFIQAMRDATAHIDALRPEIVGTFGHLADIEIESSIANTLTLSTFHGCPPEEIDAITRHLIDEHDLDVIVKLNPTLLGYPRVSEIVNEQLAYTDVRVNESAFANDLQFDRGIELIGSLRNYANERGRRFGIKLTNTLVVDNHKGYMPDDPMYLSGPPLHVVSMTLLDELARALPGTFDLPGHDGDVMVSFSAGIDRGNLADALATGVNPTTVCSDLLKPGGYGRLTPMLRSLERTIADAGCRSLATWRSVNHDAAIAEGYESVIARYAQSLSSEAGTQDYGYHSHSKLPRAVDNDLAMFECVACNFCVTVCPNDAFFSIPSLDGMESRQQYLLFAELCNECGNCMTFCPENGDPAQIKPRLFLDEAVFAGRQGQGFLLEGTDVGRARAEASQIETVSALVDSDAGLPLGSRP